MAFLRFSLISYHSALTSCWTGLCCTPQKRKGLDWATCGASFLHLRPAFDHMELVLLDEWHPVYVCLWYSGTLPCGNPWDPIRVSWLEGCLYFRSCLIYVRYFRGHTQCPHYSGCPHFWGVCKALFNCNYKHTYTGCHSYNRTRHQILTPCSNSFLELNYWAQIRSWYKCLISLYANYATAEVFALVSVWVNLNVQ